MLTALAPALALLAATPAQDTTTATIVTARLDRTAPHSGEERLFPPATEDLALGWPADGAAPTMFELVVRYGQITGQRVLLSDEARSLLGQVRVPLDRPTTVPAAEVQGFFESLLAASECALSIEHAATPRLVRVHYLRSSERSVIRSTARFASPHLDVLRAHPAMLFTTVLDLPNLDVRQLSNSLRTMIVDANTMQLLPAGNSNSLVITGFGPNVADLVEYMRMIDAAAATPKRAVVHELVRLKYAVAQDVAPLVQRALDSAEDQRRGAPVLQQQGPGGAPAAPSVGIVADVRLNALLISSPPEALPEVKQVIALLDVQ